MMANVKILKTRLFKHSHSVIGAPEHLGVVCGADCQGGVLVIPAAEKNRFGPLLAN